MLNPQDLFFAQAKIWSAVKSVVAVQGIIEVLLPFRWLKLKIFTRWILTLEGIHKFTAFDWI